MLGYTLESRGPSSSYTKPLYGGVPFYRGQVCSLSVAQVNSAESCYLLQGLRATLEDGVSRLGSGFS